MQKKESVLSFILLPELLIVLAIVMLVVWSPAIIEAITSCWRNIAILIWAAWGISLIIWGLFPPKPKP